MLLIEWAKPMRLWQVALALIFIVGRVGGPYFADLVKRSPNTWIVPPYSSLKIVEGALAPTYMGRYQPHVVSQTWGQLRLDDGSLWGFTCKPGLGDPSCAYTAPYNSDPNLGKRLELKFFDSPDKQGPPHVVMEIGGVGRYSNNIILSFQESVDRLSNYKQNARSPTFAGLLFWGFMLLLTPGLIYRLATGREQILRKESKDQVRLDSL